VTLQNMGVLDLTGKKPEDLASVTQIQNIGLILAPQSISEALMKIPQQNVGMTVTLPETSGKIKIFTGQLTLSGEVFANASGSPDDILAIAGQIVITSPIEKVGYDEIIIAGQLIAPKKSEAALAGGLTKLTGQVAYYNSDTPRFFIGEDSFSKPFFELIEDKMSMALIGEFEIESDVDAALLKQKISELILIGNVKAPKALVPLLQLLTVTKIGEITGSEQ
jgi:hypothetical protein